MALTPTAENSNPTGKIMEGVFSPQVMSKRLRRNLDNDSVWNDCVNRDYEGEIKNQGDTVKINQPGNVTVKSYVKGEAMEYESPDANTVMLEITEQDYFAFDIEDIDTVQSNITLVDKYFDRAKTAITLHKDLFLANKAWAGISTDNIIPTTGLTPDSIYNYFVDLRTKLRGANAIKQNGRGYDGKRPYAVVDPKVMSLILKAPEYIHATTLGDETIRKGTVTTFAGFDIKETTNPASDSEIRIIAGTTEAITLADQITKTRTLEDKDDFAAHCAGLYVYGSLVAQPKCLAGGIITIA